MQRSDDSDAPGSGREGQESEHAFSGRKTASEGAFSDVVNLFSLIGISIRDTARLLGLETRLIIKTIVMMVVFSVLLGAAIVGVWLSTTLVVAAALYEYSGLGVTLCIVIASLVNMGFAGVIVLVLKRLMLRLSFPQTRLAVRTLLEDASSTMQNQG